MDYRNVEGAGHMSREAVRAREIAARNQSNLSRWRAATAWLDHLSEGYRSTQKSDLRTPEQRDAWDHRRELRYYPTPDDTHSRGFFVRYRGAMFQSSFRHVHPADRDWTDCGEIDLGDVIFNWCPPQAGTRADFEQRQAVGKTLGLGDAPGSARVIAEDAMIREYDARTDKL